MDRHTFTLYVLKSLRNGKRYIGSTGQPMQVRLGQHNRGVNKWARQNRPFELLYTEQFGTKAEVTARERFLKTGADRLELDRLLATKTDPLDSATIEGDVGG